MTFWKRSGFVVLVVITLIFIPTGSVLAVQTNQPPNTNRLPAGEVMAGSPTITILKAEAKKTSVEPQEEVELFLHVKNDGVSDAENIHVFFDAPTGLKINSATSSRGERIDFRDGHLDLHLGTLKAGESAEISVFVEVEESVPAGTVIVSSLFVEPEGGRAQAAAISITVVDGTAREEALPQTGSGLLILLIGIFLGVSLVVIRQVRSSLPAGGI